MPVAIVAFGFEKSAWLPNYLEEMGGVADAELSVWNLREMMSDPLKGDRVSHNEDGTHSRTQIAVFGQEAFGPTVEQILGFFFEHHCLDEAPMPLIALGCRTGYHRAHVTALAVESGLNTMIDGNNERCFQAQVFHVSSANNKKEAEHMVTKAIEWSKAAWTSMPHEDIDALFGFRACRQSKESTEGHNKLRRFLIDCQGWLFSECDRFKADDERQTPVPSAAPIASPNTASDDSQPQSSQSSVKSPTLGDVYNRQKDKRDQAIDSRLNKPKLTI